MQKKTNTKVAQKSELQSATEPAIYESPFLVYEAPILARNVLFGLAQQGALYTETQELPSVD